MSSTSSSSGAGGAGAGAGGGSAATAAAVGAGSSTASKALKRLSREYAEFAAAKLAYASAQLVRDSILEWHVTLQGPLSTPYEGGAFKIELKFPDAYPMKPPEVRFLTQIYHPNVSMKMHGAICQEIVSKDWSPVLRVVTIIERLYAMLAQPHAESPLEADIGEMYTQEPKKFAQIAREWTQKHAK